MLLPPILEIYVLWHPDDDRGSEVAGWLLDHFHGTAFSGLIGGAVEVYIRSQPWSGVGTPPRPLPFMGDGSPVGDTAAFHAVVPLLSNALARAVEDDEGWRRYLADVTTADSADVLILPLPVDPGATAQSTLGGLLDRKQHLPAAAAADAAELGREVAQAITQRISDPADEILQVFVSHTKRHSPDETPDHVDRLVARIRAVLDSTKLMDFFDARDLQSGEDWEERLVAEASRGCLLMVRTDLYASREMCQREVRIAKESGVPVVELRAVTSYQERGSFLLDHVPSVQISPEPNQDDEGVGKNTDEAIRQAVNVLVDEALRRALWIHQRIRLTGLGFSWLPTNSPEPLTLLHEVSRNNALLTGDECTIMHPDPPLLADEIDALQQLVSLADYGGTLEVLTPRTFAQRGGRIG